MAAPLAISDDVVELWKPLTAQETVNVDAMLRYVSALIRAKVPNLDARVSAGTLDEDLVTFAAVMPVKRVLMNQDGVRQRSENTGPYSDSITVDSAISSGLLVVNDTDVAALLPVKVRRSFGSINIAMGLR